MREGYDYTIPDGRHTVASVYSEMLLQICRAYKSLPPVRDMDLSEIKFFYNGYREELKYNTKKRD